MLTTVVVLSLCVVETHSVPHAEGTSYRAGEPGTGLQFFSSWVLFREFCRSTLALSYLLSVRSGQTKFGRNLDGDGGFSFRVKLVAKSDKSVSAAQELRVAFCGLGRYAFRIKPP